MTTMVDLEETLVMARTLAAAYQCTVMEIEIPYLINILNELIKFKEEELNN